jgi:phage-related protein (TIGR01555 family)
VPVNFGGISEAFDQLMYRLSLATTIPVTILMGRSPAGMNATGESDLEMFYSRVENFRDLFVTPEAEKLISYIFRAADGPFTGEPDNWQIKYKDPRSVSPDKKIQEDKTKAETDAIYLDRGVITEEECGVSRFGPDSDSDITIDIEARALKAEEKPYGTEQEPNITGGENALQNEGASDNPGGQQGATASNTDQNRR